METNDKKVVQILAGIIIAISLISLFFYFLKPSSENRGLIGGPQTITDRLMMNGIGTAASPATLTTSYSANSSTATLFKTSGLSNIVVAGSYTPKSYGSVAYILVERSIDNGTTFYPYSTLTAESGDVLVNTSGSSTTGGTPFLVPGNNLFASTSGTAIGYSFDLSIAADYIRVSAKESTTSTAGTLNAQVMAVNN